MSEQSESNRELPLNPLLAHPTVLKNIDNYDVDDIDINKVRKF